MASRFGWHYSWNLPYGSQLDRVLAPIAPVKSHLAAVGALYLGYKATEALICLGRGFVSYFLAAPLSMAIDLRKVGDWAVITGASDGMGKEYARQLAAKGLNIVLIARNQDKTETVAQEIRNTYKVLAKVIIVDFSQMQPSDAKNIQEQLRTLRIAILINNVGVFPTSERFLACPPTDEQASEAVAVNITSLVLMTRAVLPLLLSQGKGYILNMSSGLSEKPVMGAALYASSKTFVDYFSKALDYEYRDKGVAVQCVICGMVRTNMLSIEKHKHPFTVDAADLVRNTIALIGVRQRHHGHWRHALMSHLTTSLPYINVLNSH